MLESRLAAKALVRELRIPVTSIISVSSTTASVSAFAAYEGIERMAVNAAPKIATLWFVYLVMLNTELILFSFIISPEFLLIIFIGVTNCFY